MREQKQHAGKIGIERDDEIEIKFCNLSTGLEDLNIGIATVRNSY